MNSTIVKNRIIGMGADVCGVVSADSFEYSPNGVLPRDVLPTCRSVVVFGKRLPAGTLRCTSAAPFALARDVVVRELDAIAVAMCIRCEERGIVAVLSGTCDPLESDRTELRGAKAVSNEYAAQLAGLGVIGRNGFLISPEYGNMLELRCILTEEELEPDRPMDDNLCLGCGACAKACPAGAISEEGYDKAKCSGYICTLKDSAGVKLCRCREVCPKCLGTLNGAIK